MAPGMDALVKGTLVQELTEENVRLKRELEEARHVAVVLEQQNAQMADALRKLADSFRVDYMLAEVTLAVVTCP